MIVCCDLCWLWVVWWVEGCICMLWIVCVCCRPHVCVWVGLCKRWQAVWEGLVGVCGVCKGWAEPDSGCHSRCCWAPLTSLLQCKVVGLQMAVPASFCLSAFSESSLWPCPQQERSFSEFMLPTAHPRSPQSMTDKSWRINTPAPSYLGTENFAASVPHPSLNSTGRPPSNHPWSLQLIVTFNGYFPFCVSIPHPIWVFPEILPK